MAGIGFELKKLFTEKSAFGYLRACSYTVVVTIGPFVLVTGMILMMQMMVKMWNIPFYINQLFLASVVYPFVFSQIISSGFAMLITRFVADKLYSKEYRDIVPSLYGILVLALILGSIPAVLLLWKLPLSWDIKVTTYLLYMELITMWIQGVYLTALKDYRKIIKSYLVGTVVAVALAYLVLQTQVVATLTGLLLAIDIGIFIIILLLMFNILHFFTETGSDYFLFLNYLYDKWTLFLINFFYTLGVYLPNLMIWQGPLHVDVASAYRFAPIYDVATFYAFLSVMPTILIFTVSTELAFYEKYTDYFKFITGYGNLKDISNARADMLQVMWSKIRNLIELQFAISMLMLALGGFLLPKIGLTSQTIDMYNMLVLGAYFTVMTQVIVTILLYFEDRRGSLVVTTLFLLTTGLFNYLGLWRENTYGMGMFLAGFISLVTALLRLRYCTQRIDYFVFCSQPIFNRPHHWWLERKIARRGPTQRTDIKEV